jgi:protein O-GlcNAc transferase
MASEDHSPHHRLADGWAAIGRDAFPEAERIARSALQQDSSDAEALRLLGDSLFYQDRFAEAAVPLQKVFQQSSARGVGHRLGYCHFVLGNLGDAESVLRREVELHPDLVNAHNLLGIVLIRQSRREEALSVFRRALVVDPQSAEANNNLGNTLAELGRDEEAIPFLEKVVGLKPGLADARYNLGIAFHNLKQHDKAIAGFRDALDLAPGLTYALGNLIRNETAICRWTDLDQHVSALRERIVRRTTVEDPFTVVAVSDSLKEQRDCAEAYLKDRLPASPRPLWEGTRYRHEKIRLAYLSSDFHQHATAFLIAGLLERHDRSKFEVFAISFGPDDGSDMRRRLIDGVDRFIDVRSLDDAQAAQLVRGLEVDIAIDLKGHTHGARPGILAHRPAPVQVSYLGFPGTTGADFIDYVIADRVVLPEEHQPFYSEKVLYLPDTYQVNDAGRRIPDATPTRVGAGLPRQGFVFCCFNNSFKITPQLFDIWMHLLGGIPGSVLWLLEDNHRATQNLRNEAQARGVAPERLVFAPRIPPGEHLARHRLADLFLDTLPYNAHTTASDALWTGLPVLTCTGSAFAGRVATSLLRAIGLPELVTGDLPAYEALALRLAKDASLLETLRARLASNRLTHPLFDTDRFRRHIESAYTTIWETSQRGEQPRGFAVDPLV